MKFIIAVGRVCAPADHLAPPKLRQPRLGTKGTKIIQVVSDTASADTDETAQVWEGARQGRDESALSHYLMA